MSLTDLFNECFENEEIEKVASEEEAAVLEEEAEEMMKLAEDYETAGRFMARGYVDEMEKLAGGKLGAAQKAKGFFGKGVEKVKKFYSPKAMKAEAAREAKSSKLVGKKLGAEKERLLKMKKLKRYGGTAAAAGAAGGAGLYATLRDKKK